MAHTAFQITEEDIENVLRTNQPRLAAGCDANLTQLAEKVYESLNDEDFGRMERAVQQAFVGFVPVACGQPGRQVMSLARHAMDPPATQVVERRPGRRQGLWLRMVPRSDLTPRADETFAGACRGCPITH